MKRSAFLGVVSAATCFSATAVAAEPMHHDDALIDLSFIGDEARAVLDILARRAAGATPDETLWTVLFATEGYRRLAERERSFKRPFEDAAFRTFVMEPDLLAKRQGLAATLAAWVGADMKVCGDRARAYLPAGARLHATVYPVIKPRTNSFVYDLERRPAIFLYLDPTISVTDFTYTVAHELHHVGFAQNCPKPAVAAQIERLPPRLKTFQRWLGGFGEGFAVLAGVGGPDVDPASVLRGDARGEWLDERATFPPRMNELTAFFRGILNGKLADDAVREAGMTFFGNQGAWYTVGWRMAVTIERRFGRPRLIECIADNRQFLATYNTAADGTGLPRWSDDLAGAFGTKT